MPSLSMSKCDYVYYNIETADDDDINREIMVMYSHYFVMLDDEFSIVLL